jgi:hypothetical protein
MIDKIIQLCTKSSSAEKNLSRKGAKRYRVFKAFLCAFAPLRKRFFLFRDLCMGLSTFRAKPDYPVNLATPVHPVKGFSQKNGETQEQISGR